MDKSVYEGWADAVQWYLTKKEYPYDLANPKSIKYHRKSTIGNKIFDSPSWENHQYWHFGQEYNEYSSMFIDLMDDSNQFEYHKLKGYSDYNKYPNDSVKGYPISDLDRILMTVKNSGELRQILLNANNPEGVTNQNIVDLFVEYLKFKQ